MGVVEHLSAELNESSNTLVCEHCCKMLVSPRHRWLENLQESAHVASELVGLVAQCIGIFFIGVTMIFASIFPNLIRHKDPYVEEYERYEREWRQKQELLRLEEEANKDADRLNSAAKEVTFAHANDLAEDDYLVNKWNSTADKERRTLEDVASDRERLRTIGVQLDRNRQDEFGKNQRRTRLSMDIHHFYLAADRADWFADRACNEQEKQKYRAEARDYRQKAQDAQEECKKV